jgi:TonB family protein
MKRTIFNFITVVIVTASLLSIGHAQDKQAPKIVGVPGTISAPDDSMSLPPLADPVTPDQIREYLRLSGDLDSYRAKWIAAVDKNRSDVPPYWPEAFWTDLKAEMQKTDLMPMNITIFQHGISRDLMQRVLDAYKRLGGAYFKGSLVSIELGGAELSMKADANKLTLAKTLEVTNKVYTIYKPEIEAARVRYMAVPANNSSGAEAGAGTTPTPNPNITDTNSSLVGVIGPKIIYQPAPILPEVARQQKINGIVTLSLIVDKQGTPENVQIVKSIADTVEEKYRESALSLDQAAIDTVKKYKFTPATRDGRPVAVYLSVKVNFQTF